MTTRRVLDAHGDIVSEFVVDEDKHIVNYTQDVEPILEQNKAANNSGHDGYWQNRAAKQFAEVPMIFAMKWMKDDGLEGRAYFRMNKHDKEQYVRRKLNDPDYAFMRTFWH